MVIANQETRATLEYHWWQALVSRRQVYETYAETQPRLRRPFYTNNGMIVILYRSTFVATPLVIGPSLRLCACTIRIKTLSR
jgi:hypothetical protein